MTPRIDAYAINAFLVVSINVPLHWSVSQAYVLTGQYLQKNRLAFRKISWLTDDSCDGAVDAVNCLCSFISFDSYCFTTTETVKLLKQPGKENNVSVNQLLTSGA